MLTLANMRTHEMFCKSSKSFGTRFTTEHLLCWGTWRVGAVVKHRNQTVTAHVKLVPGARSVLQSEHFDFE